MDASAERKTWLGKTWLLSRSIRSLNPPSTPACFALPSLTFSFACVNREAVNSQRISLFAIDNLHPPLKFRPRLRWCMYLKNVRWHKETFQDNWITRVASRYSLRDKIFLPDGGTAGYGLRPLPVSLSIHNPRSNIELLDCW